MATPATVTASDGSYTDRVNVSWSAVTGATAYEVWRSTTNSSGTASQLASSVTNTSYDDTSAIQGQTYFYWLKAKNTYTTSAFSTSDSGYSSLAAPATVTASDGSYIDRVNVSWSAVTGATAYEVWRSTTNSSGTATSLAVNITVTAYADTSTTPGQTYYYWLKAKNAYITSGFSTSDSGYRILATPTGISASDGLFGDRIRVSWSGISDATGYEVWRNTVNASNSALLLTTVTGTSYDDMDLVYGQTYYYWVKAKNAYTTSAFSSSDMGYTPADSTPPEQVVVESPLDNQIVQGILSVDGWARDLGSGMDRVEVWLDGSYKGGATYGLSRPDQGGNVGYHWETDTTSSIDGTHTLLLRFYDRSGNHNEQTRIMRFSNRPVTALLAVNSSPTVLGRVTYFTATATGGVLTYTWSFGDGMGTINGSVSHQYAHAGKYTAVVTATNGVSSVVASTVVTVTNTAPVADAGTNQTAIVGSVITLDGSASYDPDGHLPLTLGWTQTAGDAVTLTSRSNVKPTFTSPTKPGALIFSLVVTDAFGLVSAPDLVTITVNDTAIGSLTAYNGSPTILGQVTTFVAIADGTGLSINWAFGDGTYSSGMIVNHIYLSAGVFTAIVTASNGTGVLTATMPVTVTNLAPVANAGPDQSVLVGAIVSLDGTGSSDPDGHWPLAYCWVQTGGIPVTLNNRSAAQTSFTAPALPAVLTFTLTVTDAYGLAGVPDQVVVMVNDAPADQLGVSAVANTPLGIPTVFTATVNAGTNVTAQASCNVTGLPSSRSRRAAKA